MKGVQQLQSLSAGSQVLAGAGVVLVLVPHCRVPQVQSAWLPVQAALVLAKHQPLLLMVQASHAAMEAHRSAHSCQLATCLARGFMALLPAQM